MAHNYSQLLYHVVFGTKGRAPLIVSAAREPLYRYIGGIVRGQGGVLIEIGGIEDHIHWLAHLKPTMAVADAVRLVKANSSKWMNANYCQGSFAWQTGYGAFSVSKSQAEQVRQYIRNQPKHHQGQSYPEEFAALVERSGLEYDKNDSFV